MENYVVGYLNASQEREHMVGIQFVHIYINDVKSIVIKVWLS